MEKYLNLIGGEWVPPASGQFREDRNPADYHEVIGLFPESGPQDVADAVGAAEAATARWRATSLAERGVVLQRAADWLMAHAEQIAADLTREEGKIYREALLEVRRSAEHFRFYAALGYVSGGRTYPSDDPRMTLYSVRAPLGVVAVITPWNFPLSIPARKIAPALITGNTVVFKPASETPLTAWYLTRALVESGIPAGAFNYLVGPGSVVGDALTTHPAVRGITFTGSTAAGFRIHRQAHPTCRVQLELGGKNAVVVMDDADLDRAVEVVIKGGYNLAGQACTGTSRVVVHEAIHDAFVDRLVLSAAHLTVGRGDDTKTDVGPLISAQQQRQVLSFVGVGKTEGLELLVGGQALDDEEHKYGFYVTPAVFGSVGRDSRLFQEEIFGPVLAVTACGSLDEAISLTNDSDYGLSAAICTQRLGDAERFAAEVETGIVKINRTTTGIAMNAPFGGWKHSSTATFREEGLEALEFFAKEKTVFVGWGL